MAFLSARPAALTKPVPISPLTDKQLLLVHRQLAVGLRRFAAANG